MINAHNRFPKEEKALQHRLSFSSFIFFSLLLYRTKETNLILTSIKLFDILRNFKSVKCLTASLGNSRRKFVDRSNCNKL